MSSRWYIILFFLLFCGTGSAQYNTKDVDKLALLADSLDLQARKDMLKGRQESAKKLLENGIQLSRQSGNPTILARCYIDMAAVYIFQGKYNTAKDYIDTAWSFLGQTDHYEVKISGYLQRANYFNIQNKKDSSIYYYHVAEKYNAEKNPYRNWAVYMALGELFNQTNDPEQAVKYFQKAYDLTVKQEGKPDHVYLLTVFINFYMARDKTDGAAALIAEYNKLMEERKKNKTTDPMQDLLLNLTNFRLEDNVEFMKKVKESSLKEGNMLQAIIMNGYIITYYERRKKLDDALRYASEGEGLASKTGGYQDIYGAKQMKYSLLQKAGRYQEANAVAESLFDLKDSILTLQKRNQLYELEAKFETERKEHEIDLLTTRSALHEKEIALLTSDKKMASLLLQQQIIKENALTTKNRLMDSIVKSEQAYNVSLNKEKEKESALNDALGRENVLKANKLQKEKRLRQVLIGGAVLLLLAGAIILFQYKRQRSKKEVIQKQADELQVLMKEIHHRVKNNLQVISSLLDLQSMTIADTQASEAVKEGKNRVQSMALIHQNLYREGNIKGINAKEYIVNLLQSLCDSYNISKEKVRLQTEIDDLNLDVDTMIPLGLVLNELVSNSLKYAFKDGRDGELTIVLKEDQHHLLLKVSDNGVGYPQGINASEGKSFGMKMIRAFAQKLKAKLDIYNNNGAVVEMQITKYNLA